MTFPPLDEPSQQRRAAVYGRANQASVHYRPLRRGRPVPDLAPAAPTSREAKSANRRRFALFLVALLVAIAFGTAIFGVVLASPAPIAQAPRVPAPEAPAPPIQPLPPTGRGAPTQLTPPSAGSPGSSTSTTAPRRDGTTKPAPGGGGKAAESTAPATTATVYYQNCNKARKAGAAPLYPGDPGYRDKLDKDGNGVACDEKEKKSKA
ncbi:excalibur calcium-binding domain-containing protein [Phytohabitans sp. ZYX-F-186]|uniref:Excalibur calcium-binding domain-containing protein n=1 Tax=Phytohabitans maris TaxID=3071409 RepID=A0ABU0ZI99_9ACTN|nr:excalibur calcium-binding domain-containing protein [Phytohabitans sp. ZYX-F-186]MDQ7906784.1 excalibur calcium-binding domain-containing protein [Phytohabitans sp. ZYX-F-186]